MKKYIVILSVLTVFSLPIVANAGSAYIPSWTVNPPDAWGNPKCSTGFSVANIMNNTQTVTITLYNVDGTPAAGLTYYYSNGGSNGSSYTDSAGKMIFSVQSRNYLAISVVDNGSLQRGFGTISGGSHIGLIATVLINYPDNISLMSQTFAINGGNPF